MKYLKLFKTSAEYMTYSESGDMILPNVSYCEDINGVFYNPYVRDYSKEYLTFEVVESGNVTFTKDNYGNVRNIQYSTDDGTTWVSLTSSTTAQELGGTLSVGDKVLVKGTNSGYSGYYGRNTFGGSAKVNVYGNIMSLIYGDNFANNTTLSVNYAFKELFYHYTNLLSAEHLILPATTLTVQCYRYMFQGCTSLVTAPELPATTLAENCYESMFQGCTSLVTAPELPATTLAQGCYATMFQGCTSLVTAPELPATTLESGCYGAMFHGCTSLNYIKALFTTTPILDYTSSWVSGVASSGTFVKNSAATWDVTGNNGIPSGWTVETASA